MNKAISGTYKVIVVLSFLFFLYAMATLRLKVETKEEKSGYEIITAYDLEKEEKTEYTDRKDTYSFRLEGVKGDYNHLYFYSMHEKVYVYLDMECIYFLESPSEEHYWRSTGCVWNQIELSEEENGKMLRIELVPVYEGINNPPIDIYLGTKIALNNTIWKKDLLVFGLCLAITLCGVFIQIRGAIKRHRGEPYEAEIMLGMMAILIGSWKGLSVDSMGLVTLYYPVFSMVTYWILMSMAIPYILTIKFLLKAKDGIVWNIPCFLSFANMILVVALRYFNVADMRETLWITQSTIGVVALYGFGILIFAAIKAEEKEQKERTRLILLGDVSCVFWVAADMVGYYFSKGRQTTSVGVFFFVLYMCGLAGHMTMMSRNLMVIGMRARQYERIAFRDALTGFYNRTAFSEYISHDNFDANSTTAVVFDMNDLKRCNDTLGHDQGDIYVRESARIIRECFGDVGQCYRVGGDEFYALAGNISKEECERRIEELLEKVREFNASDSPIHMGIAYGYEAFMPDVDENIEDTIQRADQQMYVTKHKMKQALLGTDAQ